MKFIKALPPRIFLTICCVFGLIGLSACSPFDILNAVNDTSSVTVQHDLAYEPGPRHGLDVYTPPAPLPGHPVVVFIYGGAWQTGDKGQYAFVAEALARRGLTVVVPDYRVYPDTIFPGFVDDAAASVAWSKTHIAEYGGNPDNLFVMGHSAGAHIAALIALDPEYLGKYDLSPHDLAGVIGIAGPYDFLPITRADIKPIFAVPDRATTQPITYAATDKGKNPPLLLQAGEDDTTVEPRNTIALDHAVAAQGGPVEMKLYPGLGHIGIILTFVPAIGKDAPVEDDMIDFIARHTNNRRLSRRA